MELVMGTRMGTVLGMGPCMGSVMGMGACMGSVMGMGALVGWWTTIQSTPPGSVRPFAQWIRNSGNKRTAWNLQPPSWRFQP